MGLTVEVEDGLTADRRVGQDQHLQALQSSLTELCRHLQAEVSNALQLQHLQVSAAAHFTKETF